MNYQGVTEASRKLHSLIRTTERTVIVKRNQPCAVLLSFDDYQTLVQAARREMEPEAEKKALRSLTVKSKDATLGLRG